MLGGCIRCSPEEVRIDRPPTVSSRRLHPLVLSTVGLNDERSGPETEGVTAPQEQTRRCGV